jgi:16S rRNA (adenine1518-N6/adenine1519-N6)-dimethyltransferase
MNEIRPKKRLGQHFLKDRNIARKIARSLTAREYDTLLEIGPGTGMLTRCLIERGFTNLWVIEIDSESVDFLRSDLPDLRNIIEGDFLTYDIDSIFRNNLAVTGNFPYNISSQIFFRILEYRSKVTEVCCMVQKEVAERICASPGSRTYGILSVLLQAFYRTEYLFTVPPQVFYPVPKVQSGVIRLTRNETGSLGCNEPLFFRVVKTSFGRRRKMLRNSVGAEFNIKTENYDEFHLRPEQLSVDQFVRLTNWIDEKRIESE